MATKITITFEISDEEYNNYDSLIDEVLNNLDEIGAENIEVDEKTVE